MFSMRKMDCEAHPYYTPDSFTYSREFVQEVCLYRLDLPHLDMTLVVCNLTACACVHWPPGQSFWWPHGHWMHAEDGTYQHHGSTMPKYEHLIKARAVERVFHWVEMKSGITDAGPV